MNGGGDIGGLLVVVVDFIGDDEVLCGILLLLLLLLYIILLLLLLLVCDTATADGSSNGRDGIGMKSLLVVNSEVATNGGEVVAVVVVFEGMTTAQAAA